MHIACHFFCKSLPMKKKKSLPVPNCYFINCIRYFAVLLR